MEAPLLYDHGSDTVAFDDYVDVLNTALVILSEGAQVTFFADRGFEHRELIIWLKIHHWSSYIQAKSNFKMPLNSGQSASVAELLSSQDQAHLFPQVHILDGLDCHLATATVSSAQESWAVITDQAASRQKSAHYDQRFGGIEPHLKATSLRRLACLILV